ncbi:hypothetical protein ACGFYZ_35765 [Streptomyces sp. NPDC048330]|uniref:hypothetical protein n=1 Tax=Streptomyces sp. NPDC048330 TaxID=3365533 RepID=UPI0037166B51
MSAHPVFHPGSYTPEADEKVCDCAAEHRRIDVAGHLFPAIPPGCLGREWRVTPEADYPGKSLSSI